jgi:hypothetical protein
MPQDTARPCQFTPFFFSVSADYLGTFHPTLTLSGHFTRLKKTGKHFSIGIIDNQHSLLLKIIFMSGLLYLIAVILIIGWLLGVFVYSVGGLIHVLIVLAIISLILGIIRRA